MEEGVNIVEVLDDGYWRIAMFEEVLEDDFIIFR